METAEGRALAVPAAAKELVSPSALEAAVGGATAADPSRVAVDRLTSPVPLLTAPGQVPVAARRRGLPLATRPVLP